MIFNNTLFIHIPKTGGNSFQKNLYLNGGYRGSLTTHAKQDFTNRFEIKDKFTKSKHQTLSEYNEICNIEDFKIVTIIREPTHRLLSSYFGPFNNLIHRNYAFKLLSKFITTKPKFFFKKKKIQFNLDEFINMINHKKSMSEYLKINGKVYKNINILNFEEYDTDINKFLKSNNLKNYKININKAIHDYNYDELIKKYYLKEVVKNTKHFEDYQNFNY
jgi:hypothetical protein